MILTIYWIDYSMGAVNFNDLIVPWQKDGDHKVGETILHRWLIQLKLKEQKRISFFWWIRLTQSLFILYKSVNIYISELRINISGRFITVFESLFRFFTGYVTLNWPYFVCKSNKLFIKTHIWYSFHAVW